MGKIETVTDDPSDKILKHLSDIAIKGRDGGLKKSFLAMAGMYSQLWRQYSDYIVQTTQGYENRDSITRQKNLMDVVIFAKWNAYNFPALMSFKIPEKIPEFPAQLAEIFDFPVMVGYMVGPVSDTIKDYLCGVDKMDMATLEQKILSREAHLLQHGVEGLEVLKPRGPEPGL